MSISSQTKKRTMSTNAAQDPPTSNAAQKVIKPIKSWIAHDPVTLKKIGSFKGRTPRSIAQKIATRNAKMVDEIIPIVVRETGTRRLYHFDGQKIQLPEPKQVARGDRIVTYTTTTKVKTIRDRPKEWSDYMASAGITETAPVDDDSVDTDST